MIVVVYNLVMVKNNKSFRDGFTLIELVMVLAIAGLLITMIFVALSQVQKSRRDAQRKADLDKVVVQLNSYSHQNNGAYPLAFGAFWSSSYVTGLVLQDPSGGSYATGGGWPAGATQGTFYYRSGVICDGSTDPRGYSIKIGLESGEVCRDSK